MCTSHSRRLACRGAVPPVNPLKVWNVHRCARALDLARLVLLQIRLSGGSCFCKESPLCARSEHVVGGKSVIMQTVLLRVPNDVRQRFTERCEDAHGCWTELMTQLLGWTTSFNTFVPYAI